MKVSILQSIANTILDKARDAESDKMFKIYYDIGIWFDSFCIRYFNIYLD